MKKRFKNAVVASSELKALLILGLLLCIRAWRTIPHLRPRHLVMPASFAIITVFIIAALSPQKFMLIFSTGIFIVLAVAMFPMLHQQPKPTAHWVKAND